MWAKFQGAGMVLLWQPAPLTNLAWVWFHPSAIRAFSPFSFFFRVLEFYLLHNGFPYAYCYLFIIIYLEEADRYMNTDPLFDIWSFFLKMNKYITQLCTCFASYKWTCSSNWRCWYHHVQDTRNFPADLAGIHWYNSVYINFMLSTVWLVPP